MSETQLRLFDTENPLRARFERDFFKQIPLSPGVYWMLGRRGDVLYVGKAKNLRARLRSYRHASLARLSPKIQRLLASVHEIHWDVLPDEASALLRENEWLRTLKPPFNTANTKPETYLYLGYAPRKSGLKLGLYFKHTEAPSDLRLHGAYKGLMRVKLAHAALLRWLWALTRENCSWPHVLARKVAPNQVEIPWGNVESQKEIALVLNCLEGFLSGHAPLPELVLPEEDPVPFLQVLWRDDRIHLDSFFTASAKPYRQLRADSALEGRILGQEEVDDLIVLRRFRPRSRTTEEQGSL